MNEKLTVKNFGPIKEAELDLKKVTVFIGPQGSGKSTLAKLVAICKEEEKPSLSSKDKPISFKTIDYGIEGFIKGNTVLQYNSNLTQISFDDIYMQDWTDEGHKMINEFDLLKNKLRNARNLGVDIDSTLYIELELIRVLKEYKIPEPVYIPENRSSVSFLSSSLFGLMSNNINLPKILTEFGNKYSKASTEEALEDLSYVSIEQYLSTSESNKTKYIELFDIEFQHRNGQDILIDSKNNYEVNLRDSASGMQSSIPLILVVRNQYFAGDKHFIVEEPELNLFPTTQKQLVGYLADKCTQNGNELLMTTHSPYVLSSLNILLFAYQVANKYPESAEEVEKIIPRKQWLNPDDFAAYYVGEDKDRNKGGVHSIFNRDKQTQLIGENELDEISDELGDEFNELMNIYRTKKRETVN